ncbi:uncharacterized protein [Macaca fascicularis]|uniref:uncharacterized protein n=1 Tax=Macaca fascicularis TaxID=9541 RepID=UPI0032B07441
MRPCAAPAVRPGIWRRDGGNIRQIFKTEPREQSRSLCSEAARELGAAGPRARRWARRMRMRVATCELGFRAGFYPAQLPGGHKKAKGFLCDIILARSSLTNLDLQVSMAIAAGTSLAPDCVP